MKSLITFKNSLFIERKPEFVWDFTQDFEKRRTWDKSIIYAVVIKDKPKRIVSIQGNRWTTKFIYKMENRPVKSSLAMTETKSLIIAGGGGSWNYEKKNSGTL